MKNMMLALNLILKRKALNFFIIVQILLALSFLLPSIGMIKRNIEAVNMVSQINRENGYYLYMHRYVADDKEAYKMFYEKVEDSKYIEGVAEIYYLYDNQEKYKVIGYNHVLMHYIYEDLEEKIGRVLQSESGVEGTIIPVIITRDTGYKYGEIFPLTIEIDEEMEMQIQCKVIKVLNSPRDYLNLENGAGEGYYTPAILQGEDPKSIILPVEYLTSDKETLKTLMKQDGKIMLLNEEGSYERLCEDFSKFGYINNMEAGVTVLSMQVDQVTLININLLCVFMGLTLIGIISCNLVQLSYNKKILDIYYMLGMSKRQGRIIEFMRNFILVISCFLIFIILLNRLFMGISFILSAFEPGEYRSVMLGVLVYLGVIFWIPSEMFQFFVGRKRG